MHRRPFLIHCGFAAAGALLLPVLAAPDALAQTVAVSGAATQVTAGDRTLLRLLSAYGTDAYFWGNGVLTRATGVPATGTINLLVRVDDYSRLVAFLRSEPLKRLGRIRVQGNTLSFTFQGTAYTVTNEDAASFTRAVAGGGVTRSRTAEAGVGVFSHQTLLYHPATDVLSDPNLVLTSRKVDLVSAPTGGIKAKVQTLVDGWLEAKQHGLKLGKKFRAFQDDLLAAQPTEKAAHKIVLVLLENLAELATHFNVDDLRPLLTSPLVSAALQSELGLDAETVLADVEKLRGEVASGDYSDAALFLATLLGSQIKDGTASAWLEHLSADDSAHAATRAALTGAERLVASPGYQTR